MMETQTIWCNSPEEIETKRAEMLAAGVDISNTMSGLFPYPSYFSAPHEQICRGVGGT